MYVFKDRPTNGHVYNPAILVAYGVCFRMDDTSTPQAWSKLYVVDKEKYPGHEQFIKEKTDELKEAMQKAGLMMASIAVNLEDFIIDNLETITFESEPCEL